MTTDFIDSARKQFEYYKMLGDKSFAQLSEEQLSWTFNDASNSIATIVKHMSGNMLSRWTDFLHSDGEKQWRNRDTEFENDLRGEEILVAWKQGWNCLFAALDSITETDLGRIILIRNEPHSVMEAINRQLAHYPYHIGQIVFIAKMLKGNDWVSLSIPKGGSDAFNKAKFK